MNEVPDGGDSGMPKLASFVVLAILGTVAFSLDTIANSSGPSAQTAATTATVALTDYPPNGEGVCSPSYPNPPIVRRACHQTAPVSEIQKLEQTCSPGFSFKVEVKKGVVDVTPSALQTKHPDCQLPNTLMCKSGGQALQSFSSAPCQVVYCVGGTCTPAKPGGSGKLTDDKNLGQGIAEAASGLKTPEELAAFKENLGPLSDSLQSTLNDAFNAQESSINDEIAAQRAAVEEARRAVQVVDKEGGAGAAEAQAALERQQAELQRLEAQKASLAAARKDLELLPPPGQDPPVRPTPETTTPTPTTCDPAGCTTFPTPDDQPQPPPGGGGQGMPELPKPPGGGGGSGSGGGGQGQQCQAGQVSCKGSSLFVRDAQCKENLVKYCEYGCAKASSGTGGGFGREVSDFFSGSSDSTSSQCAPAPQQCQQTPATPSAENCQGGTWQPTYSGVCVTGWQCSNGSGTGPKAELSCQPKVVDVGMNLAITYSCSAGKSVGSGFSTDEAQSGATTVEITSPPEGTNTATYALTCTNQGLSSNTSCSVQVAKPAIVLVTNPSTVEPGATSALGWITTGMKSCVISSDNLSSFNSENESNTSVNGTVTTPALTSATEFKLHCVTIGGGTREAQTTIQVQ